MDDTVIEKYGSFLSRGHETSPRQPNSFFDFIAVECQVAIVAPVIENIPPINLVIIVCQERRTSGTVKCSVAP